MKSCTIKSAAGTAKMSAGQKPKASPEKSAAELAMSRTAVTIS